MTRTSTHPSTAVRPDGGPRNVFLVPFDRGNFDRTVGEPVDLTAYPDCPEPLADLEAARFWGARTGTRNRNVFERMEGGDLLLFYTDGTYVGMGLVGTTFEDGEGWVSATFWNDAPSRLVYTVEEYEPVRVSRAAMNAVFGYSGDYYPQGVMRVADDRVDHPVETIRRAVRGYTQRRRSEA